MKMNFRVAILASIGLAMSFTPAVSQVSECGQLRVELNAAQQDLASAQSTLYYMAYDRRKASLEQAHSMMVSSCYLNNAPGMDNECVLDADMYLEWEIQALDDGKAGYESEVSIYESLVQDYQQRIFDAHC